MNSNKIYLFIASILLFLNYGCIGIKANKTGSLSKNIETFYISPGVTQYFLKSIDLKSDHSNNNEFDITFRKNENKIDSITLNFTLYLRKELNNKSKLTIYSSNKETHLNKFSILFVEHVDGLYTNRVTTTYPFKDFIKILNSDLFYFKVENGYHATFNLTKNSKSKLKLLNTIN